MLVANPLEYVQRLQKPFFGLIAVAFVNGDQPQLVTAITSPRLVAALVI